MILSPHDIARFKHAQDDTALHVTACNLADAECFRLYGTDSIGDPIILWPRWQEFYKSVVNQVWQPNN